MLRDPQLNKDYNLYTDASKIAMGAVLIQFDDDNQERIIICINKVFSGPQLNYYTTEKELAKIVWSLRKLNTYLFGSKVYIFTDHKALI